MGYKEKLQVVLDVDGNGAATGLRGFIGNFRSAVGQAEGMAGKFKAGVGAMGQSLTAFATSGAGMTMVATGAAAALGKMVMGAQELALKVGQLSDQTGLSAEQASRLIEVTGDLGISSETLGGLLGKMTQNLGKTRAFKAMGIEVQQAADGTVDMNATLLQAISSLHAIQDPTKRAEAAAKLFGKGWKDASELISMGADQVKAKLESVGDAKIKTGQQVKEAREFRDSLEDLKDISGDLAQEIGTEVIPMLTTLAKAIKTITGIADAEIAGISVGRVVVDVLTMGLAEVVRIIPAVVDKIGDMGAAIRDARDETLFGKETTDNFVQALTDLQWRTEHGTAATMAATEAGHDLHDAMRDEADATRDAAYEAQLAQDAAEATQRIKDLHDELSGDKSLQDLKLHLRDNASRLKDLAAAYDKTNKTAEDNARYMEEVAIITDDSKLSVLEYVTALGTVPAEVATDILTNMDPNNVQATIDKVQDIASRANLHMDITVGAIADSTLRNLLEGRGTGTPTGLPGTPSAPPSGDPVTPSRGGSGSQQGLGGPHRGGGGDVYLQLDRQTLVVFKNALDDLSRGTR